MPQPVQTITFVSAISDAADTADALKAIIDQLGGSLDGSVDLLIAFATPHHAGAFDLIHDRLSAVLRPAVELAVTVGGVIGVRREVQDGPGLSVLAARLPGAVVQPFSYEQIDWPAVLESPEALRQTISLDGGTPPKAILLLTDPFSTPMVKLLPALGQAFAGVPVVGGVASGAQRPGGNRLLFNGRISRDGAIGAAIGGDVHVHCTVSQGCRPIGRPLVITKSRRHIVQQLGGHNALGVINEMVSNLGTEDRELVQSHGLLVGRVIDEYKRRFGRGDFLIRHLLDVDQQTGCVAISDAQVRVGQTIQFHVRDKHTARQDFSMMLEAEKLYGPAGGALLFSCNGRGTNLFDEPHTDALTVYEALGDTPLAGCFAAGEIGPIGDESFVHGHTASLVVFRATDEQISS